MITFSLLWCLRRQHKITLSILKVMTIAITVCTAVLFSKLHFAIVITAIDLLVATALTVTALLNAD